MSVIADKSYAAGLFDSYNQDFSDAIEAPSATQALGDIYDYDSNFDTPIIKANDNDVDFTTFTTPFVKDDAPEQIKKDLNVNPAVQKTPIPETENRTIKEIQILGTNTIDPALVMQKINLQSGDIYGRDLLQNDLKAIYQLGFFTEKMRAIPIPNDDGTVTIKIMLQENAPISDFTVEGNTVVSTEDIMNVLMPMKGKPQNIGDLNEAIAKIQDMYTSQGYVLSRVDSVSDDPDGTVNVSIKEGKIDKIMIEGNEKTKDYVVERNILTEPGTVYNENVLKEDLVRLYATQAFKDVTREIEPSENIPDAYDITIKVQEQRTASISIGGGLDTVTGVFGSLGIADNNFRGVNQRLSLNGLAGTGVIMNDASIERRMNLQAE